MYALGFWVGPAIAKSEWNWWEDASFGIGWKGHVYLPGHEAGRETAAALASILAREDLAAVAPRLGGVFGLFVRDKHRDHWRVAVDNAGCYKLYYDDQGVSTSFLRMMEARRLGVADLLPEALVEYLAFGAVLGAGTLARGIRKLGGGEILEFGADGAAPRLLPKDPDVEEGDPATTILTGFADLVRSLAGRRVSVDATGGFDSRLVACLLHHHGADFEMATSGRAGVADVDIARAMAGALRRPWHLSGHDLDRLDEELAEAFRAGDGVTDVRRFHRDRQLASDRRARGVEVIAHGGGGELLRDHCFVQDFPFYGSAQVRLQRYYDMRMMPVALPASYLSDAGSDILRGLRDDVLGRFSRYMSKTNNETYDRIYFHLRVPEHFGQHYTNYINSGMDVVAPLLDHKAAYAAIGLSPWRRFFYGWHREVITKHNPALAALPTAEGFSASSHPAHVLSDLRGYGASQLRRAAKKASQRIAGKARFHTVGAFAADAPGFIGMLRASPRFAIALDRLKELGILSGALSAEAVRDIHVGRLLTLGMLAAELDGAAAADPPSASFGGRQGLGLVA